MKKSIFIAALLVAVACSNDNQLTGADKPEQGRKVTINATIAGETSTRINFQDNEGLKGTWNATETMTVVSIDVNGYALSYDLFTSVGQEGRTSAAFTGTLTSADAKEYVCYYPALKPVGGNGTANAFQSDSVAHCGVNDMRPVLYIPKSEANSCYIQYDNCYVNQIQNNSVSHLENRLVLKGLATFNGDNLNVEFKHQLTVLKLDVSFPAGMAGTEITDVHIKNIGPENAYNPIFVHAGWGWIYSTGEFALGGSDNTETLCLGGWPDDGGGIANGLEIPLDGKMTLYFLTKVRNGVSAGNNWVVSADNAGKTVATKTLTWQQGKTLETGKMYTLDVAMEAVK